MKTRSRSIKTKPMQQQTPPKTPPPKRRRKKHVLPEAALKTAVATMPVPPYSQIIKETVPFYQPKTGDPLVKEASLSRQLKPAYPNELSYQTLTLEPNPLAKKLMDHGIKLDNAWFYKMKKVPNAL